MTNTYEKLSPYLTFTKNTRYHRKPTNTNANWVSRTNFSGHEKKPPNSQFLYLVTKNNGVTNMPYAQMIEGVGSWPRNFTNRYGNTMPRNTMVNKKNLSVLPFKVSGKGKNKIVKFTAERGKNFTMPYSTAEIMLGKQHFTKQHYAPY